MPTAALHSWGDPSLFVKQIHVEESCLELPYTQEILARAKLPYTVISDFQELALVPGCYPENHTAGKQHLLLRRNRGQLFKPCPATPSIAAAIIRS